MMIHIRELDKSQKDAVLPLLFDILHANMSKIAPTGNSYEEDLAFWLSCVSPALEKNPRRILLLYDGDEIAGFFQYFVNNGLFMMEEIQFRDCYQGTGVFSELYAYLTRIIPKDTEFVEAYANKGNHKSIAVLNHLGLEVIGENKNGISYHFRGRYETILRRYGEA